MESTPEVASMRLRTGRSGVVITLRLWYSSAGRPRRDAQMAVQQRREDRPEYLSISQVATTLNVSTQSVRTWIARGYLPAIQLPGPRGSIRISTAALGEVLGKRARA